MTSYIVDGDGYMIYSKVPTYPVAGEEDIHLPKGEESLLTYHVDIDALLESGVHPSAIAKTYRMQTESLGKWLDCFLDERVEEGNAR